MKYLVHVSFPYFSFHSLIMLNKAEELIEEGNAVDLLFCGGGLNHCYTNLWGDKRICFFCKKMQKNWAKLFAGKVNIFTYKDFIPSQDQKIPQNVSLGYETAEEIKKIKYKGVEIGYGALSTYISYTRNLNPKIDNDFRVFFNPLLETQIAKTEILKSYIEEAHPDSVVLLNGRHFEVKPFFDFPRTKNIDVICLEKGTSYEKDKLMGFNYHGFKPHDVKNLKSIIEKIWEAADKKTREDIGNGFFIKRKNNEKAGDKIYTENQELGLLPKNWDDNKRNFVILNSSEDELSAIGDEFSKLSIYPSQIDGIRSLLTDLSGEKNINVYLRVHPNLQKVNYKYHKNLYALENEFENLTVIKASEKTSTYTLIEKAEKVIVFGSTAGIEAAYWGKPVILLGGALYYYLDVAYIPKNKKELFELLIEKLNPKGREISVKYGYYIMAEKGFELNKLKIERAKNLPFKPLKIEKESYKMLFERFLFSKIIEKISSKNRKFIPTQED